MTTYDQGYAKTDLIEYGEYIVKEITASVGYNLDKKEYPVKITKEKEIITLNVTEKIKKYRFEIKKMMLSITNLFFKN